MTIAIVGGAIANKPGNGGASWTRLSWILGLQRLGFDVYFLEQLDRVSCVDSEGAVTRFETSANLAYFQHVIAQFGLAGRAALIYEGGEQVSGLAWPELVELSLAAELLVNISGHLTLEPLKRGPRRRVYLDLDPGYTQFWQAAGNGGARLADHDVYYTIGENIGAPDCPIPTGGIHWRHIRQPVTLEHWPATRSAVTDRFTTVASWRGPYGRVEHAGVTYGLKAHQFRQVMALPRQVAATFEVALDIHPAEHRDLAALRQNGWRVIDPGEVASDPARFRDYVQRSAAEFSVSQGIYVETNSGWFSDRTVRYLASGKPALVQDTGFSRHYPVGEGLLPFRSLAEACAGAERVLRDYERHSRAARALAETYFDSDLVLSELIDQVGVAP